MGRKPNFLTREEMEPSGAPEPSRIEPRYTYREAFIMSPKLQLRMVQVLRISDGIAILQALGEGKLMISTEVHEPAKGYHPMAKCEIKELIGKMRQEIYTLLDQRTDAIEREKRRP